MIRPDFPLDHAACGELLANPDTTATALHTILLTAYGDDLYGADGGGQIDPVLLWTLLREDFSVTVPEENENRINALMLGVGTDAFYQDLRAFRAICMALYDGDMGDLVSGMLEQVTLSEILWGVFEVALNRDDNMELEPRILQVVRDTMAREREDGDFEFTYFVRALIAGKTQIVRELTAIGCPEAVLRQVVNFDETPIHTDAGELITPTISMVQPALL